MLLIMRVYSNVQRAKQLIRDSQIFSFLNEMNKEKQKFKHVNPLKIRFIAMSNKKKTLKNTLVNVSVTKLELAGRDS